MPDQSLDAHYDMVIRAIAEGDVVPFLGAGANRCGRPAGEGWQQGRYLPDGRELSKFLAEKHKYPESDKENLLRVSQYIFVMEGSGPLYKRLHGLLDADYSPTQLNQFLATLPKALRERAYCPPYQLVVTTNYDDLMERAFQAAEEAFDLVTYVAEGERRGKFLHRAPDGKETLIEKPDEYSGLSLDQRTVILKIHGAVDRIRPDRDSFVITEDHYIDYLTRTDISNLIPVKLTAKMKNSHFLFLGYSLSDWNLRVILHRIWGEQILSYKSWAIQLRPSDIEKKFWGKREVDIIDICLEDYIAELSKRIQALVPAGER